MSARRRARKERRRTSRASCPDGARGVCLELLFKLLSVRRNGVSRSRGEMYQQLSRGKKAAQTVAIVSRRSGILAVPMRYICVVCHSVNHTQTQE